MAHEYISTAETPEEAERRRRAETARRIKILFGVALIAVTARLFISDPKRKAPIDYTKMPIKIVPGMLDTLPASTRANLDPKIIAQMTLADEMARRRANGELEPEEEDLGPYKPTEMPLEKDYEAETYKEQLFAYAVRKKMELKRQEKLKLARDIRKTTLVKFRSGGWLQTEDAIRQNKGALIIYDNTMLASYPNRWVTSITKDTLNWESPVPRGSVRLKPAPGITVILNKNTAKRVTIEKSEFDEI